MKTRRAGTAEANIIQMGKGVALPMGWMNQPRAVPLVTSSPLGTFSFCTGAEMSDQMALPAAPSPPPVCAPGSPRAPHPPAPYLRVGVLDEEVSQGHDEDGDGHPEVPDQPPHLWGRRPEPPMRPPAAKGTPPHSLGGTTPNPTAPQAHLAGQEHTVLELTEEEGEEEGAGHEHEGQQRRVGFGHGGLRADVRVVALLQRVGLEDLRVGDEVGTAPHTSPAAPGAAPSQRHRLHGDSAEPWGRERTWGAQRPLNGRSVRGESAAEGDKALRTALRLCCAP